MNEVQVATKTKVYGENPKSNSSPRALFYVENETTVCPVCGGKSWWVRRATAECGSCQYPMPMPESRETGQGYQVVKQDRHIPSPHRGKYTINGQS